MTKGVYLITDYKGGILNVDGSLRGAYFKAKRLVEKANVPANYIRILAMGSGQTFKYQDLMNRKWR